MRKRALSVITAGVLLISGCSASGGQSDPEPGDAQEAAAVDSATEDPEQDPTDDGDAKPAGGGTSPEDIISTIEEMGFECEEQDRTLKMVSLGIECRADDYLFLTASQFSDPAKRDSHYEENAIPLMCGDTLDASQVHWSVRDDWLLVPGGERDKDFAAHDEASEKLGFEVRTHTCE